MVSPAQEFNELASLINLYPHNEGYIRRCISTAYYAVFRLIIDDGLPLLFDNNDSLVMNYHRKVTHKTIKSVCDSLGKGKVDKDSKLSKFAPLFKPNTTYEVHDEVATLAKAFSYLQIAR
jgi:hypothetical protein